MPRPRRGLAAAALALCLVAVLSACFSPPEDIDVEIADGTLRGVSDDGVQSWLGIPYAAPPVGDLRWRAPEPPEPWTGVREADEFESECPQIAGGGISESSSEDCLYLNVFRPDTEEQDLPVMVWLHGGGLILGNGDLPIDTVTGLVEQDVVVVSLNYRLGRLGYFAHPALAAEGGQGGPVGNFGLLDQVAALEWVQANIEDFGGDPDAVTVFGISAGGASVNYLMTSPLAQGLFDRAISGSGLGREQPRPWQAAAAQGEALTAAVGLPGADADALRELDAATVTKFPAYQLRNDIPVLDRALPEAPSSAFAAGREAAVPYVSGTTDVELPDQTYLSLGLDPAAERERYSAGREAEVDAAYADDPLERERHFLNDLHFTEPARNLARLHADRAPTYLYRFAIASDSARSTFGGAIHGTDYPFVFGWTQGAKSVDDADALTEGVSECWASFAKAGVPSCAGVDWPEVGSGLMEFTNSGPEVLADDPWQARLDLAETIRAGAAPAGP